MLFTDAGEKLWGKVEAVFKAEGLTLGAEGRADLSDLVERRNKVIGGLVQLGVTVEDAVEVMMQEGLWDGPLEEVIAGTNVDSKLMKDMQQSFSDWQASHAVDATKAA